MSSESSVCGKRKHDDDLSSCEGTGSAQLPGAEWANPSAAVENNVYKREIMSAAGLAFCRAAFVKNSEESSAAHAKYGTSIDPKFATVLELAGNSDEDGFGISLGILESKIVSGDDVDAESVGGFSPLDIAKDDACRALLQDHAAVVTTLTAKPTALVSAAVKHCSALANQLEASETTLALPLSSYHFDPSFLWAPPEARAAVVAWARNAFTAQQVAINELILDLSDDCAGDVLEFLVMDMTRKESSDVLTHCSSPEACAWIRAVVVAAVAAKAIVDVEVAVEKGDLATVQDCLAKGVDVDTRADVRRSASKDYSIFEAEDGSTLLIKASERGHTSIVKVLLKAGADKDAVNDSGFTALMKASLKGHTSTVKLLLEYGAATEAKGDDSLTMAAAHYDPAIVEILLKAGADANSRGIGGTSPLIEFSMAGDSLAVGELLLEAGADIHAKDEEGNRALAWASKWGKVDVVELLLEAGADKNAKNNGGETALIMASKEDDDPDIVEVLLEAGVDKEARDESGKTALDWALQHGHTETAALLQ